MIAAGHANGSLAATALTSPSTDCHDRLFVFSTLQGSVNVLQLREPCCANPKYHNVPASNSAMMHRAPSPTLLISRIQGKETMCEQSNNPSPSSQSTVIHSQRNGTRSKAKGTTRSPTGTCAQLLARSPFKLTCNPLGCSTRSVIGTHRRGCTRPCR